MALHSLTHSSDRHFFWPSQQSRTAFFANNSNKILTYLAWALFYSKFVHPLRDFPGPWVSAATRIPYWIACLRGDQVPWMRKLHGRYDPVVRFGPNDLSYSGAQAWKDIYGHRKGREENPRDPLFYPPSENGAPSVADLNAEEHAALRRLMAPAFSDRAVKAQEPMFRHFADLMVDTIRKATTADGGQPGIDMVKTFNLTTFDIMAQLTYGESLGLLESSEYTPWVELVFKSIRLVPILQILEYYPLLKTIFKALEPQSVQHMRISHYKHSADRLHRRLERGSDQPDIWNLVAQAQEAGAGDGYDLTVPEMESNSQLFMAAGTETTATLLSGLTYLLLTNRDCLRTLTDEIRTAFASSQRIDLESLARLPYLNACIEEGLRMYPPVPSGFPRATPAGGNVILGRWVPPGTSVSVHTTTTYRDPDNFRDPDRFVPERWMGDARFADDKLDARQPFSVGPRSCLGMGVAWHEMRLLLSNVLMDFDLELCTESMDWLDQKVYILWQKKPLMCRATARTEGKSAI
ncbi:cytochrome P450 monooxygenase-like protein [Xylariomycetidae sp. FL2044]|nr:cytochrome P450 monooxygenase-like protein [Xylariomycetidae sp. FL2044]